MSLASVKPYFRTRLESLGYVEHKDAFNVENIAKTALAKAYHVEMRDAQGVRSNQDSLDIEVPLTVRVFIPPRKDAMAGVDLGIAAADTVIADTCSALNRLTQSGIKNVLFQALALEPLAQSNDNGVIVRLDFTVLVILSIR